ncbi:helix-turn-helix domain-containing protein [Reichenbachiella ulvae]|uniref:Helix-turn-helix transcriptional regulator n=1 Tax=Reichenbachiella ulvae TaxID=2980104 RepID=A0ABT3CUE9_9BACT|nr:helix-turn-helix transcriptional regulator [Reichenbachiella ulvae]MCV9387144.1 helix-turn-helix transcriptional regulator [Reichenbachiella ulvae]
MILHRQKFEYKGRALIEKIRIQAPFRYEALFEDEGCFLYVNGSPAHFHAADQKITLPSNESVLLKCGTYFVDWLQGSEAETCEVLAVHLPTELLRDIYRNEVPSFLRERQETPYIQKILPELTLSKFIESLDFYFDTPALVTDELLELKIKELILILVQTRNAESILELFSALFAPRKVTMQEVIQTHLYSDLTVSQLAELCHMSLSSFKREFVKHYGDSPKNYLNGQKLERARELLQVSEEGIARVAYQVGYSDPAYFSRLFKSKFGYSPSEVRQS